MTDKREYYFKSSKTTVILEGSFLRIKRKGLTNVINHGLDGEKSIDLRNVTSVQLKEPRITTGYLQFAFSGSNEGKSGVFEAVKDENTIAFIKKDSEKAHEIKKYAENIMNSKYNSTPTASPASASEEIRKYKELLDDGIISEEEFQTKKKQLLEM